MFDDHFALTRAVLEGRKTMTRRIVSIPDTWHGIDVCAISPDTDKRSLLLYDADEFLIEDRNTGLCGQVMPLYKIGEEVAVAQKYKDIMPYLADSFRQPSPDYMMDKPGYNNKMFVRADLMPNRICITSVRVERIQDISEDDCLREGIYKQEPRPGVPALYAFETCTDQYGSTLAKRWYVSPREAFAELIDKVSGKGTWDRNPWVFVYEFEKK